MTLFSATVRHPAGGEGSAQTICGAWFIADDPEAAQAFAKDLERIVEKHNLRVDSARERQLVCSSVDPC